LRRCIEQLGILDYACVGGVLDTTGCGYVGKGIAIALSSRIGVGTAAFRTVRSGAFRSVDTVAFGVYRAAIFDEFGVFDEALVRNQDDEFNLRLTKAGRRIGLEPSLVVRYHARTSLRALARQYFQYGYYKVLVVQKSHTFSSFRQFAPVALVFGNAAAVIVGWRVSAVFGTAALAAYLALVILGSIWTRSGLPVSRKMLELPVVVGAVMIMHFAYGSGYTVGLMRNPGSVRLIWREILSRITSRLALRFE
jgi:hypothetical protein